MVIYGVALLSACFLAGNFLGDILGALLHVKANVGGVGFAMLFLILLSNKGIDAGWLDIHPYRSCNEFYSKCCRCYFRWCGSNSWWLTVYGFWLFADSYYE